MPACTLLCCCPSLDSACAATKGIFRSNVCLPLCPCCRQPLCRAGQGVRGLCRPQICHVPLGGIRRRRAAGCVAIVAAVFAATMLAGCRQQSVLAIGSCDRDNRL